MKTIQLFLADDILRLSELIGISNEITDAFVVSEDYFCDAKGVKYYCDGKSACK